MKAKRTTIYLWIAACVITALSSCTVVEPVDPFNAGSEQVAVEFATGLDVMPSTRAGGEGGNEWAAGDSVGVFMVKAGGNLSNIVGGARNYPYITASAGSTAVDLKPAGDTIYYPMSGSVNFILYHPYTSSLTGNNYNINVSEQSVQEKLDLMYVHDTNNYDHTSGKVTLSLTHQLSKLVFIVRSTGSGAQALPGMTLSIGKVSDTTVFDLSAGHLADGGLGGQATINTKVNPIQGDSVRAEAIVLPVTDATKVTLLLNVGGKEYHAYLPAIAGDKTIKAGYKYTYHVSLDITNVEISGSLTPWNIVDGGSPGFIDTVPKPVTTAPYDFMFIEKGAFMMGRDGAVANEAPQHTVTITRDFYLGKFEVTNIEFAAFLNTKGITADGMGDVEGYGRQRLIYPNAKTGLNYSGGKWVSGAYRERFPIVDITWYGAKAFADWMGCSLPTEAQWEHACRAGTTTTCYFGDNYDNINSYEYFVGNCGGETHQVGEKNSNQQGLYDMCGNVAEMCADWYAPTHTAGDAVDPVNGERGAGTRVWRGGSVTKDVQGAASTTRGGSSPDSHAVDIGLRLAYNI
ncbi:MAG: SUMF1/EgtB/PvdO family nonheme iron enzyme [Tannerellaceae bacterium]|jgi:formylglycine-generating enzyme required for sulfatase activity|nr:SUMF1/EgtB/PvdO family nonheme iron enzyme [Tannerellaceae bacterium]